MKITKLGHCCLLIDEGNLRILTDPGDYSALQDEIIGINLILITHEHSDHLHLESLKAVLKNNPQVKIITNDAVGKILAEQKISFEKVVHGQNTNFSGVLIEGFGDKHADIYDTVTVVQNTGYFIANQFFYPGDALTNPEKPVKILALPVAGPWIKIREAVEYGKIIKPEFCFPVHDGMLRIFGAAHRIPQTVLTDLGVMFHIPNNGQTLEF